MVTLSGFRALTTLRRAEAPLHHRGVEDEEEEHRPQDVEARDPVAEMWHVFMLPSGRK